MNPITRKEVPVNKYESKVNPDSEKDFQKIYAESNDEACYV